MTIVTLSPFALRVLTILMFLFIPISIISPHTIVLEIIIGGLISLFHSRKEHLADFPQPLMAILIAFPIWGIVTALWSKYPMASLLTGLKIFALVILGIGWCRLCLSLPTRVQMSLTNAFIGGLLLGMLFLLLETWLGYPWTIFKMKSSSQAFSQGSLMVSLAAWPTILWILQRPYSLPRRWCLFTCFLASIVWVLFQMDCDTSFIGLFLGIGIFSGIFFLPRLTSWGMRFLIPLFILSFPFISLYAFKSEYFSTYNSYIHSPSYLDRLHIWNDVATSIFEHPWQGIGMDGTPYHEKRQQIREWSYIDHRGVLQKTQSDRFSIHPHNAILQLWLELGFLGVILGVLLAHFTILQIFSKNLTPLEKAACAGLFTGTFMIIWVNLGFWQSWWIGGLWVILGLTISMLNNKRKIHERNLS